MERPNEDSNDLFELYLLLLIFLLASFIHFLRQVLLTAILFRYDITFSSSEHENIFQFRLLFKPFHGHSGAAHSRRGDGEDEAWELCKQGCTLRRFQQASLLLQLVC